MPTDDLGDLLTELVGRAQREVVLCAPFAKADVVQRILHAVPMHVTVHVFTRWRPEEVAAGVSDTAVLDVVRARAGTVSLLDRLHAKYYRTEAAALLGSANLTGRALGWTYGPNLELLHHCDIAAVAPLEAELKRDAVPATAELAAEVERVAAMLPRPPVPDEQFRPEGLWLPSLREPGDLYRAYSQGPTKLSSASAEAATRDLAYLRLPVGLDVASFRALVGHRMLVSEVVHRLDDFLSTARAFGEVRQQLQDYAGLDRSEAERAWQTSMRWLLEFLPGRYHRSVARHSELFARVESRTR